MKNAEVTAFELDRSGNRLAPNVGTTRTDNAGEYTLNLGQNYQGGLIEIVVSADSATRMVCDASECGTVVRGQEISSGLNGLTLTRLAQPTPGQTNISAPVSAWTTLAANRAKTLASGRENLGTAIAKANRVVSEIVGYDITKVQAKGVSQLNANSSPEEAQSAALNAVVAEIIFGGSNNFGSALADFSRELDDGKIELEGISTALDKVIAGSGNAIATNVLDSLAQRSEELKLINELDAEDIENSVTAPDAPLADKIQDFKNFLTQVRQLGDGLGAFGDSNALDTALGADEATLTAIFDSDTVNTLLLSFNVIGQALNAVIDDPQIESVYLKDPSDGTTTIGSADIVLVEEDNSFTLSLDGEATGSTGQSFLPFDLSVTVPVALAVLTDDNTDLTSLEETTTLQVDGTVGDQNTNVLIELTDLKATLTLEEALAGDNGAALDGETVLTAALDGELSGALNITAKDGSESYTFNGDVLGRLVTFDDGARIFDKELPVSLEEIRLSGEFSGSDNNSFAASAALRVRNAREFDVFGWLDLSSQSVTEGGFFNELPTSIKTTIENLANRRDYSGDIRFDSDSIFDNEIRLINHGSVEFTSAAFGDAELQEALGLVNDAFEQTYNLDGLELDVSFAEMRFNKGQGGGITAVAEVEGLENADSFLNATISLTTDVNYAGFSGKAVATVSRNSLIGGNLNINFIAQGVPNATAQNLRLQVSSTDLEGAGSADITFSSPAGFRLAATVTFDDDQEITALTGDAFVGDDDIGDIELRNGVPFLVYAENNGETNFESLF